MRIHRIIILGSVFTALVVTAACASSAPTNASAAAPQPRLASVLSWRPRPWQPPATAPVVSRAPGLRVAIDPIDGAMSMPLDPISTEQVMVDREGPPIPIDRYANGRMVAHLDDRFAQFAVVTVGADGKPHWSCVNGAAAANRTISQPSPTLAAPAPGTVWEDR